MLCGIPSSLFCWGTTLYLQSCLSVVLWLLCKLQTSKALSFRGGGWKGLRRQHNHLSIHPPIEPTQQREEQQQEKKLKEPQQDRKTHTMYTVPDSAWPTMNILNPTAPPPDSAWGDPWDLNRDEQETGSWCQWDNNLGDETLITASTTPLPSILHPTTAVLPPTKRQKITSPISTPKPTRKQPAATTIRKPTTKGSRAKPISSHIPFEIWLEIFSYCAPSQLAKLRRVNSSFKAFIDDEKIWAKSRRNTFPNYPEPMYGFPENYMWNLWKGSGCEICGAPRFKKCYWTWGIRLCTTCFKDHRIRVCVLGLGKGGVFDTDIVCAGR